MFVYCIWFLVGSEDLWIIFFEGVLGLLVLYLEGDINMKLEGLFLLKSVWLEIDCVIYDVIVIKKLWFILLWNVILNWFLGFVIYFFWNGYKFVFFILFLRLLFFVFVIILRIDFVLYSLFLVKCFLVGIVFLILCLYCFLDMVLVILMYF